MKKTIIVSKEDLKIKFDSYRYTWQQALTFAIEKEFGSNFYTFKEYKNTIHIKLL